MVVFQPSISYQLAHNNFENTFLTSKELKCWNVLFFKLISTSFLPAKKEASGRGGSPRKVIESHANGPYEIGEDDGRFEFNED